MKQHHIFLSFFIFTCTALCSQTQKIQPAHLAGSWYPKNKTELNKNLDYYFSLAEKHFPISNKNEVSALIVPHASYHFSGLCAASAYQAIQEEKFDRVIILGPSHKKKFSGIALPDYKAYKTPLGTIAVDTNAVNLLAKKNRLFKTAIPDIWQTEHSVEIQLPFLQFCLTNFEIIPLIIGNLTEKEFTTAAQQLGALLTESKKTLIIVSSDFIHYGKLFKYTPGIKKAEQFNTQAIKAILNKSYKEFNQIIIQTGATICGQSAIKILLRLIEQNALGHVECTLSSLYNSAQIKNSYKNKKIDVANLKKPVDAKSFVSYAGIVCTTKLTRKEKDSLLLLARYAITKKLFPKKILPIDKFKQTNNLEKPLGAFVTLKTKSGKLRAVSGQLQPMNHCTKQLSAWPKQRHLMILAFYH